MKDPYKIFGLSSKAKKVFQAVLDGHDTPVKIWKETNVSRPAVYAILRDLQNRDLLTSKRVGGFQHWTPSSAKTLDAALYEAKRSILGNSEGTNELYRRSDASITLHQGKDALQKLFQHLFEDHKGERYRGVQGDNVIPAWRELFGTEAINGFNRAIKKNAVIVEAILPKEFFPRAVKQMGIGWARDFEGRTYRVSEIEQEYFNHGAEIFLFGDTLYLASMSEALVIEIKHSEIQKMIALLLTYIQDTARSVDGNERLRELIALSRE